MNKISKDYEELKKAFESQKCPKDDKILALRKTARALETENELLQEEKQMIGRARQGLEARVAELETELRAGQEQSLAHQSNNKELTERLLQAEAEKQALAVQLTAIEKELTTCKSQINKVNRGEVMNKLFLFISPLLFFYVCFFFTA